MRAARTAYFVALLVCLPLFIHTWGLFYNADMPINAARTIGEAVMRLWQLQFTAILISAPWFSRVCSIKQVLQVNLILILTALPFFVLGRMADAITNMTVLKIIASLLAGSLLSMVLTLPFKHFRCFDMLPVNLDMPSCLMATIFFWKTGDLWLRWLI